MAVREDVREQLPIEAIVFNNPSYDNSIIGTTTDGRVVYSYSKMVEELMRDEGMEQLEAEEFIQYNPIRALPYIAEPPVIMYDKEWEDEEQAEEIKKQ